MRRRDFLGRVAGSAAVAGLGGRRGRASGERPNFLWLVSEDNSPWLGCYGDSLARTPHLDRLAREGVLFTRAFVNAPVCAPSRSTLHTGMHAASLGSLHMRSRAPLPPSVHFFTADLRESGYQCVNGQKTDYNTPGTPPGAWDERRLSNSLRGLSRRRPFFRFINFMATHESSLLQEGPPPVTDPARVRLAPHHPDTPVIRRAYARYYDRIALLDTQIGEVLAELEKSGLAENTIVFYLSDHGGVLPWSKRFLYERGTRIPCIVRFPRRFQNLAPGAAGGRVADFVSFVDFAPTMLSLAGVEPPSHFQGRAFLGPAAGPAPQYIHGYRGRMDERYDGSRSARDGRFRYLRNYYPHLPWGRRLDYLWRMPAMISWEEEYQAGRCNEAQSRFFQEKPTEELYDLTADPDETVNLADNPDFAADLLRLCSANRDFLRATRDVCFLAESEMHRRAHGGSPFTMTRETGAYNVDRILAAAETASERDPGKLAAIQDFLADADSGVRYWGAVACSALGPRAKAAGAALTRVLADPSPAVQVASAEALGRMGETGPALKTLRAVLQGPDPIAALEAADAVFNLGPLADPDLQKLARQAAKRETSRTNLGAIF